MVEAARICWRATHWVDGYCNQPLRGAYTTETLTGPNTWRLSVDPDTGVGHFLTSRWPVINVLSCMWSNSGTFPPSWYVIPLTDVDVAGGFVEDPAMSYDPGAAGADAYFIGIAPGYVCWPRNSTRVQMAYINGWPHTSLTSPAPAGATTLSVDDVTGMAGLMPQVFDEPNDETVCVTAVSATNPVVLPSPADVTIETGPGTLTLANPTTWPHDIGTTVSTMPYTVQQACILHATAQALVRGASSITAQRMPGKLQSAGGGIKDIMADAKELLDPFKRVI